MPSAQLREICPVFLVADIVEAAEWYRDKLGFRFDGYWGEPPTFAMVYRDGVEIFLSGPQKRGQFFVRPNRSQANAWDAYIRVVDIKAMHQECLQKGVFILRGPETTFYDMVELEILDINGYSLCFGQELMADAGFRRP